MKKYLLLITGEGEAPANVKELLPWANKFCKVAIKDRELTRPELDDVVKRMITAINAR